MDKTQWLSDQRFQTTSRS